MITSAGHNLGDVVTTIKGDPQSETLMSAYALGAAYTFLTLEDIKEIMRLTLINPIPPPPVSFSPPPPELGSITGSVTLASNVFSFSITFGDLTPDSIRYAFFTADGALASYGSQKYNGKTTTYTTTLKAAMLSLVSYAQVVALNSTGASTNVLTLNC